MWTANNFFALEFYALCSHAKRKTKIKCLFTGQIPYGLNYL